MVDLDHLWFSLGVVRVISLFATITAQTFNASSARRRSILVGPFLAAALEIIYSKWRPTK